MAPSSDQNKKYSVNMETGRYGDFTGLLIVGELNLSYASFYNG